MYDNTFWIALVVSILILLAVRIFVGRIRLPTDGVKGAPTPLEFVVKKYEFTEKDVEDIKNLKMMPGRGRRSDFFFSRYEGIFRGERVFIEIDNDLFSNGCPDFDEKFFKICFISIADKEIKGEEFDAMWNLINQVMNLSLKNNVMKMKLKNNEA